MTPTPGLRFLMIVQDPGIAAFVASHGVDRLFVDLEVMGKEERQGHLDTVRSVLDTADITPVRDAAPDANLLVRINPLYEGSRAEIDDVIARGADAVMLPMFHDTDTLSRFYDLLAGRVEAVPLFETVGAIDALPGMIGNVPLTDLHIGLNDLYLERGDPMMFTPLAEGVLEEAAAALKAADIRFGLGGVARAGEGAIPPGLVLGEHVRLGSTAAILSRTFHRRAPDLETLLQTMDFPAEIAKLRRIYRDFADHPERLEENCQLFRARVAALG